MGYAGSCHKKGAYEEPDEDLILKQILHFYALFLPCRRRFRLSHHEKCRYHKSRRIQIKDSLKSSVLSVFSYDKRGYCITCGACPSYYRIIIAFAEHQRICDTVSRSLKEVHTAVYDGVNGEISGHSIQKSKDCGQKTHHHEYASLFCHAGIYFSPKKSGYYSRSRPQRSYYAHLSSAETDGAQILSYHRADSTQRPVDEKV